MKMPKIINKNGREYIFVKQYPNHALYKDSITHIKECFTPAQLGLLKEQMRPVYNIKPENDKWY